MMQLCFERKGESSCLAYTKKREKRITTGVVVFSVWQRIAIEGGDFFRLSCKKKTL